MRAATREKNSGKGGFLQKIEPITVARTLTEVHFQQLQLALMDVTTSLL